MATAVVATSLADATLGVQLVATVAATYVDSKIANALFGVDPPQGNKVNDLQIQGTKEGSPSNRLFGKHHRVSGTLIWMPRTREVKDKQKGGKAGSNSEFVVYRTFGHAAIEIARTPGDPLVDIPKIYANGKLFFNANADLDEASNKINATLERIPGAGFNDPIVLLESDQAAGGPDLSQFVAGKDLTVSGFTDGVHDLFGFLTVNEAKTATNPKDDSVEGTLKLKSTKAGRLNPGDSFTIQNDSTVTEFFVVDAVTFTTANEEQEIVLQPPIQENTAVGETINGLSTNASKNNGAMIVVSSGFDDRTDTSFLRYRDAARWFAGDLSSSFRLASKRAVPEGTQTGLDSITLTQELPNFSRSAAGAVRIYLGDSDQAPDPLIQEFEEGRLGSGKVQAFTNRAYMVVEDFDLTDFGFLPQFEAQPTISDTDDLAAALEEFLSLDVGLSAGEYDVSSVSGTLDGWVVRGLQGAERALADPMVSGALLAADRGGVVTFLDRANLETVAISDSKLGAHAPGEKFAFPFNRSREAERNTVDKLWVGFHDPAQDFRTAAVPARGPGRVRDQTRVDLGVALTRDQGTQLAETLFNLARVGKDRFRLTLPPSEMDRVDTGKVLVLGTHFGRTWSILAETVELGNNYLIQVEGQLYESAAFTQTKTGMLSGAS